MKANSMERFWSRVDKTAPDGCWLWTGPTTHRGHGRISWFGSNTTTHKLSWIFHFGVIPNGLWVLHNCPTIDRPHCVNPDHLYLGTQADNVRDAVAKQQMASGDAHGLRLHPERAARGERHGRAKLTETAVMAIRRRYASGVDSAAVLAREFDIGVLQVRNIVHGRTWGHLPVFPPTFRPSNHLLDSEHVAAIRQQRASGVSAARLALLFGVTERHIRKIVSGQRHRDYQGSVGPVLPATEALP